VTGKDKVEGALSREGSSETPAVICYESICFRDHWDQITQCPWWYAASPKIEHQLAWRSDAIGAVGSDWFILPLSHSTRERQDLAVEQGEDGVFRVSRATGQRELLTRPAVGGWRSRSLHSVKAPRVPETPEAVDAEIEAPPDGDGRELAGDGRGDLARELLGHFGRERFPVRHIPSPLWCCYDLWGFEGMMTMAVSRPDLVARACERLLAHRLREVGLAVALGARGIWIEECMTDMVSPATYEKLCLPYVQRLVEAIRSASMKSVHYFCGNPNDRWESLSATGADALALEESKKDFRVDIDDVASRVGGRMALLGNLDAVGILQNGDDDSLRGEIDRQTAAGKRNAGRFIMSIGSPVTPGTSVERVRRYFELVRGQ